MRSRAKRFAVSTMIVRTPLSAIRASSSANPGRTSIGSADDLPGVSRDLFSSGHDTLAVLSHCTISTAKNAAMAVQNSNLYLEAELRGQRAWASVRRVAMHRSLRNESYLTTSDPR